MHKIRLVDLKKLFKINADINLPKKLIIKNGYLTSKKEYEVLATLCNQKNPKKVFEIGTFEGYGTLILAMNSPQAIIYTLDLPKNNLKTKFEVGKANQVYIGFKGKKAFEGTSFEKRINCLKGDSATFDFSRFKDKIDLVFIDGAHTYEYTKNDTEKALSMLKEGGVIIWHDYNKEYWPDTFKFLEELSEKIKLYHLEGTYLVFYIRNQPK